MELRNAMTRNKRKRIKVSLSDRIFDIANVCILVILFLVFIWPLWFMLIASVSDHHAVTAGEVLLLPKGINFEGYKMLLEDEALWRGYANTIFYSVAGTAVNMVLTICCAFPLSVKEFRPRKYIMYMLMFTMYFGGGLIPTYLVVRSLHLLDTPMAMIVPGAISFYNCLIVRSYFMNSIPSELYEASSLDGANLAQYLTKVVLPLSKPVLAVVMLYYFVGHWNDYYTALIYLYDDKLYPLQTVLKNILLSAQTVGAEFDDMELFDAMFNKMQTMKYSVIIVAMVPVMILYPFIQKYFVKGTMIGSVKG